MTRTPGFLVALLLCASVSSAQLPISQPQGGLPPGFPQPGSAQPGAPRPTLPARDNAAPAAPVTGTAVMRGRVLTATGTPLRRAVVAITMSPPLPNTLARRTATTDAEGKWEFADLPAASYTIQASKGGYVTMAYGQRRPFEPGKQVVVKDGEKLEQLDVSLQRGAAIAGRVSDEYGEPVAQVTVQAMRYTYSDDGQRRLNPVGGAITDDLGLFRVFGLMPGDYVVSAGAGGLTVVAGMQTMAPDSFAPTYYPGTPNSDEAQALSLSLGQEASIQLQLAPTRLARVTGVVVNSQGAPVPAMPLSFVTKIGTNGFSSSGAGATAADGTFTISNVTPGEHSIEVRPPRSVEGSEFGSYTFTATGEPMDVRITTNRGATLSGRIVWEGTSAHGAVPPRVRLQRSSQAMDILSGSGVTGADGQMNEDNTFRLAGVGGKGTITVLPMPAGWVLKSVSAGGNDLTDVTVDLGTTTMDDVRIVLTDKQTDLTGQVTDARGAALKDYQVVIVPVGLKEGVSPQRFVKMLRPNQDGRFSVKGLPPGRYAATALEWMEQGRQFVPEFQDQLRKAGKAFTLTEGQSTTIDLKLTEGL